MSCCLQAEWAKLAAWVVDNNLFSPNVRWMIQVCSPEALKVSDSCLRACVWRGAKADLAS